MASYIDAAVKRIKIYAFAVKGMSCRELAREAKLNPGATRYIHKETWNPDLSTLRALEKVIPDNWMDIEVPQIFNHQQKEQSHD